jgi:hypothetical protein
MMILADANIPSLADYYAGAIALLVVVVFAKFVTHVKPRNGSDSSRETVIGEPVSPNATNGSEPKRLKALRWVVNPEESATFKHWTCVVSALVGAAASFTVLGWGVCEPALRVVVAVSLLLATVTLVIEIGQASRG